MATYIQNMLNNVLGDGARATKFDVQIEFTNAGLFSDATAAATLVKATNFPSKSHTQIDLMYKGRNIPIKGQTKFEQTWQCTFYLTEDMALRNAFETWIEALDQKHNYFKDISAVSGLEATQNIHYDAGYIKEIHLFQNNFDNDQNTAEYILYNAFPIEVSQLSYSSDNVGTVQEFTVTFAYSHHMSKVKKGQSGNFVDEFIDKQLNGLQNLIDGAISSAQSAVSGLASDAIGAGKEALENIGVLDTNNINKANQSSTKEQKQFVSGISDMTKSLFDVLE